jgi:hypothetical protein
VRQAPPLIAEADEPAPQSTKEPTS